MALDIQDDQVQRRLDDVLAAYLEAVDSGWAPDRRQLLGRYPDLASELAKFFHNNDAISHLARPADLFGRGAMFGKFTPEMPPTNASDEPLTTPYSTITPDRPRFLGDYELLEELPRGGMGFVYKARQISLGRFVALKTIRAGHFASSQEVERFRSEARQLSQLDHPNIVPVYEVREHDGQHFFTMKFIEGGSLADRIADWELPICDAKTRTDAAGRRWSRKELKERKQRIVRLLIQVARAVQHAHDHTVLHRDLKPGNILLDAQEQPHVADFGLATRLDGAPGGLPPHPESPHYWTNEPSSSGLPRSGAPPTAGGLTETGAALGTPAYMAPEQARGRKGGVSTAIDVYGLGALLYKLLTGRPPVEATTREEILRQLATDAPARPRARNPQVDLDLEAICLKCLRKDPQERYASALAMVKDLERWQRGMPLEIRARSWPARAWHRLRRNAVLCAITAVIGFAAGAALLYSRIADPNRAVVAFHEKLEQGKPVELLGATGKPAWLRWPLGEGELTSKTNEPFAFSSIGNRLITLLPSVPVSRYRISADVRHDSSGSGGLSEVGLFFGYNVRPAGNTLQHEWLELLFADYGRRAGVFKPRLEPDKKPQFSHAEFRFQRFIEEAPKTPGQEPRHTVESGVIYQQPVDYLPPIGGPPPWRHLEITVKERSFEGSWNGQLIEEITDAIILRGDRGAHRLEPLPAGEFIYQPRGALGLIVKTGQVSFRNVVVEPLP
jgi:serine/threonine protein kinase